MRRAFRSESSTQRPCEPGLPGAPARPRRGRSGGPSPGPWVRCLGGRRPPRRYGAALAGLGLVANAVLAGPGVAPLEELLALADHELPAALPPRVLRAGALLAVHPTPEGVVVVEADALTHLDSTGATRWRLAFARGLAGVVAGPGGRWMAGHTTRLDAAGTRETLDWIVDVATGTLRALSRETHRVAERSIGRAFLALDPLPFEAEDSGEGAPAPAADVLDPGVAPALGHRDARADLLLEEGLFVLRTTRFAASGRQWWSLYRHDPATGAGQKLCDGERRLDPADLRLRLAPEGDRLLLMSGRETLALDPATGELAPAEAPPPVLESPGLTVGEVYHLRPGGPGEGLVLVHPEGRRTLALHGRTVDRLVPLPGQAVAVLTADRKRSVLADDVSRELIALDLDTSGVLLAAHEVERGYQEVLNRALREVEEIPRRGLAEARATLTRIRAALADTPGTTAQLAQARAAVARARILLAIRLADAGRPREARGLLSPPETPALGLALLDLVAGRDGWLREELPGLRALADAADAPGELVRRVLEAELAAGDARGAAARLARLTRGVARDPELAALAFRVGDHALRGGDPTRAAEAYAEALRLKPSSAGAARKLARARESTGDVCGALHALAPLAGTDPEGEPGGLRSRILDLALSCGDLPRARALVDGLRFDHPLDPGYLEKDADLLVREGHPAAAVPKLRALLRLHPGNERLRAKLRALRRDR